MSLLQLVFIWPSYIIGLGYQLEHNFSQKLSNNNSFQTSIYDASHMFTLGLPFNPTLIIINYYIQTNLSLLVLKSIMSPELLVNLIGPGIIIPLGTFGNGLALWTLFFSKVLKNKISR